MKQNRLSLAFSYRKLYSHVLIMTITAAALLWPPKTSPQFHTNQPGSPIDVKAKDLEANGIFANWLSYNGDLTGRRYSRLKDINRDNVSQLELKWVFHSRKVRVLGATPVVVGGVIYLPASNDLFALDGVTGAVLWHRTQEESVRRPDDESAHINRGVAVLANRLYMETDDGHLLSLDARSGNLLWDMPFSEGSDFGGVSAPFVVQGKVIVGVPGDNGLKRGVVAAFDAVSGKETWRFKLQSSTADGDSSSQKAEPHVSPQQSWMPGTYDPDLNLIYQESGFESCASAVNTQVEELQLGGCLLAFDLDTGDLKWQAQLPAEEFPSLALSEIPMLVNLPFQGQSRKAIVTAQSNGFLTLFDRANGHLIRQRNLNWAESSLGQRSRYSRGSMRHSKSRAGGTSTCPQARTSSNWNPSSYSERTGLLYFARLRECPVSEDAGVGQAKRGVKVQSIEPRCAGSIAAASILAYNPSLDTSVWQTDLGVVGYAPSGVLTTESDLLLSSGRSQSFQAYDALTGKLLWSFPMGQSATGPPISYSIATKQYFAIAAGNDLFVFGLP